jgi:hypothetical protein
VVLDTNASSQDGPVKENRIQLLSFFMEGSSPLYFSNHHRARSFDSSFFCTSVVTPLIALAFLNKCFSLSMM